MEKQCVLKTNVDFKPHMLRVINFLSNNHGLIVVHGTGSGKTLTAIGASQCLLEAFPEKQVLVVTPTSLEKNFKKEMLKYGLSDTDPRFIFRTYGQLLKFKNSIAESVDFCADKILICDEAHNIKTAIVQSEKDPKGLLARVMIGCAKKAFRVILLTATPVVNSKMDIANLIAMVNGTDPVSRSEFDRCLLNGQQLRAYLNNKTSFYTRDAMDPNYPRTHEQKVFLTMDDDFYKAYHRIEQGEFKDMSASELISTGDVFAFLSGVRRAMNVAVMENSPKIEWIVNLVRRGYDGKTPGKTLIYSTWKKAGKDLIISKLKAASITFTEIHGSLTKKQRDAAVQAYNFDPQCQVLLITKAGGEGLDLKNTKFVVLLDPTWNSANEQQVVGRAARFKSHEGAERDVYIYKLYLKKPDINWFFGVRPWNDKIASADILMHDLVTKKTADLNQFMAVIRSFSIEENARYA
jgi:SNF2 family DNA or RNA helicase